MSWLSLDQKVGFGGSTYGHSQLSCICCIYHFKLMLCTPCPGHDAQIARPVGCLNSATITSKLASRIRATG